MIVLAGVAKQDFCLIRQLLNFCAGWGRNFAGRLRAFFVVRGSWLYSFRCEFGAVGGGEERPVAAARQLRLSDEDAADLEALQLREVAVIRKLRPPAQQNVPMERRAALHRRPVEVFFELRPVGEHR